MKWIGWLVVHRTEAPRILKLRPDLKLNELCFPIEIEIPDIVFEPKLPLIEITIDERTLPQLGVVVDATNALNDAGVQVRMVNKLKD